MTIHFVLYILALVCLFLAAVSVPVPRVSLFPLGMFFWLLAELVGAR